MGKTKHNKRRNRPKAPTGLTSVQNTVQEDAELHESGNNATSKKESAIQTVIEQLQGSVEDKLLGLHSLASIYHSPVAVGDVVHRKVTRIAGPLLLDPSSAVRNAAAGALRNLSSSGEHAVCDLLLEQDIMTPLVAVIHKSASQWQVNGATADSEATDTFIQAVHLLWNLCESNSRAVQYFNEEGLLPVLMQCFDTKTFGLETTLAVVQCLHTVTEDNPSAITILSKDEQQLQRLLSMSGDSADMVLLRTLIAGLLLNLHYGQISSLSPALVPMVMGALVGSLERNHRKLLNEFTSSLPLETEFATPESSTTADVKRMLEAQQTAVEIVANLCSGDDCDDESMELDSSDTGDSASDSGLPEDDSSVSQPETCPLSLPTEVHEGIVSHQLVQKIWDKTILPAENVCDILKEHASGKLIYKKVCILRCRAFLCLSNLVSSLGVDELGGPANIYKMWLSVGNLVFKHSVPEDIQLLEAATTLMRAALQRLAEIKSELISQLEESDVQLMFNGELQCSDMNVRANLIRIVGTLGVILANSTEERSKAILKSIGQFLLDASFRETQLWLMAEALDAMMNVFGEDETDSVAADICLVERLRVVLPTLKNKVRLQRKSLGEHYLVVTTVNSNLARFIQYKAKRVAQLQRPV